MRSKGHRGPRATKPREGGEHHGLQSRSAGARTAPPARPPSTLGAPWGGGGAHLLLLEQQQAAASQKKEPLLEAVSQQAGRLLSTPQQSYPRALPPDAWAQMGKARCWVRGPWVRPGQGAEG